MPQSLSKVLVHLFFSLGWTITIHERYVWD